MMLIEENIRVKMLKVAIPMKCYLFQEGTEVI